MANNDDFYTVVKNAILVFNPKTYTKLTVPEQKRLWLTTSLEIIDAMVEEYSEDKLELLNEFGITMEFKVKESE